MKTNKKSQYSTSTWALSSICLVLGCLMATATVIGLFLPSSFASADNDSVVDEINITVPISCTLSGTGTDSHNATINNGQYNSAIGESTIKAFCNDSEGFAIYAVGFTDDEPGKNVLSNSTLGSTFDISTGTLTAGNASQWAMKLSTITSPVPTYPIIIAGSTADTDKEQGDLDYTSFQEVPDDYTKVAYRKAGTDINPTGQSTAEGATIKSTYQVYISQTQPAGTYTGQVKYTLVHPNDATAPIIPVTIATAEYLQDVNTCPADLSEEQVYILKDSRDEQEYKVAKLADGRCWMLDNLALDITNSITLNAMNENNTNASNTTLEYLKGITARNPNTDTDGGYATASVTSWNDYNSYSAPLANLTNKNTIPSDTISTTGQYKVGGYYNFCAASAGSYCYGNDTSPGSSTVNATESICPAGWRIPISNSNGEFAVLANIVFDSYSTSDAIAAANYRTSLHLPLSGYFDKGTVYDQNSRGLFWGSTRIWNIAAILGIDVSDNYVYSGSAYFSRNQGNTLRCILDS